MFIFLPVLALWDDVTLDTIGVTAEWTSKVELADLDGDGWVDILFANGGEYDVPGTPESQRVFRNLGNWDAAPPHFEEITDQVFGAAAVRLSRVIKVRDVDGDGDMDIFVGGAHGTASALFVQGTGGVWSDESASLPAGNVALGDAELGDVDGDGDLDLVLADWGGVPVTTGGPTRLWLNDGDGGFTDATSRMPTALVGMSWDLELIDIDDDADLDVLVSCKFCSGGKAYVNDGGGTFADESSRLPQRANNYEYEPMDIDGDGDLDLVTINDGPSLTETVLINDGDGQFADETATRLPGANNVAGSDDNVDTFLDVDSDGDADWIIGSLNADDRLAINDGTGRFTVDDTVFDLVTGGTLGLQVADLDHDDRLDVVQSQGEVADPDKVFLANTGVAADTAAPSVTVLDGAAPGDLEVVARVHDRKSPSIESDWSRIEIEVVRPGTTRPFAMSWRGEYLWVGTIADAAAGDTYRVCAVDAAGNRGCSEDETFGEAPDAGGDDTGGNDGCCSTGGGPGSALLALFVLGALLSRPSSRSSS